MRKAHGKMKRHIRTRHPKVYELEVNVKEDHKDTEDIDLESDIEYLKEYIFEEQTVATDDNSKVAQSALETSRSAVPEALVYEDVNDVEPVWNASQFDDIEYISETDPESEKKIKWLAQRCIPGKRSTLSCVRNFYKPVEPNHTYNCLFCRKNISIVPYSCSNLRRHLKTKHKKQYKLIIQCEPERKTFTRRLSKLLENCIPAGDFTKKYFEALEEGKYKCRSCGDVIQVHEPESLVLFKHIHVKHGEEVISELKDCMDEDDEFSVMLVKKKDLGLL